MSTTNHFNRYHTNINQELSKTSKLFRQVSSINYGEKKTAQKYYNISFSIKSHRLIERNSLYCLQYLTM